tara:strand:- start:25716 stop:26102 length:387 start_codon:yes stop_codon:yes gene_type:complete
MATTFAADAKSQLDAAELEAGDAMAAFAAGRLPEYLKAKADIIAKRIEAEAEAIMEKLKPGESDEDTAGQDADGRDSEADSGSGGGDGSGGEGGRTPRSSSNVGDAREASSGDAGVSRGSGGDERNLS